MLKTEENEESNKKSFTTKNYYVINENINNRNSSPILPFIISNKNVYNTTRSKILSPGIIEKDKKENKNKKGENKYYNNNIQRLKEIIEKIKNKRNSIKSENKIESPMERYNKIKKQFITYKIGDNLKNKNLTSVIDDKKIFIRELKIDENKKNGIFLYKIDKGNNIKTVRDCFKYRLNWEEAINNEEQEINLFWKPLSQKIDFNLLSHDNKNIVMANHYEFHTSISNKLKMFINLMNFTENKNINLFSFLPVSIIIDYGKPKFLKQFKSFIYLFSNIEKFIEDPSYIKNYKRKYSDFFLINYEHNSKIGMKTPFFIPKNHYDGRNLWLLKAVNLNRGMCIKLIDSKNNCEDIIKNFYHGISKNKTDDNKNNNDDKKENKINEEEEKENLKEKKEKKKLNNNDKNENIKMKTIITSEIKKENKIKIIKQHEEEKTISSSLKIVSPLKDQKEKDSKEKNSSERFSKTLKMNYYQILNVKDKNKNKKTYQSSKLILQKYIEKPLLYHQRKFDMRVWVLLTHKMEIYVFKEGHLKATSYDYNINSSDTYVHLTNYSVQKHSKLFSKFEYGNEISFKRFQDSLKNEHKLNIDVKRDIFPKLCNIIRISIEAVKDEINKFGRKGCFEIFGYDFMFDKDINPFLIEINTNPGFEISSPLISKLVPRMIDDALRLTVDKVFGIKYKEDRFVNGRFVSPFHVDGYKDDEIMYDKIMDFSVNNYTNYNFKKK